MKDTIAPTIVCPRNPTVNTNPGVCYFTGTFPKPIAFDSWRCKSNNHLLSIDSRRVQFSLLDYSVSKRNKYHYVYAKDACGNQRRIAPLH
ncbi:MAG: hypothetical protein IPP42_18495 [Saprospiraceae bacterium]|nr:hypothetical protein [Saprospiraceae bacterium]